ncbi:MAG TPA: DUF4625 domain-containing protein [Saprospiraceae bacterium]|nr:DUF4625 domain-containing protein [Saprospiraceae bacterium]
MNKVILRLCFILAVPQVILSCAEEDIDRTAPELTILDSTIPAASAEICGGMEDQVYRIGNGDTLGLNLQFKDDVALGEFKLDIHNNFDCHGHGTDQAPGVAVPDVSSATEDWSELIIEGLDGTMENLNITLMAPENVTPGVYHFSLQVIDESGNDTPLSDIFSIKAYNRKDTVPPVINAATPERSTMDVQRGDKIRLTGSVRDNRSLSDGGNGVLYLSYTDLSSGNSFLSDIIIPFDNSVQTTYEYDFEFTVPRTISSGRYRLSLSLHDGLRNIAERVEYELNIPN